MKHFFAVRFSPLHSSPPRVGAGFVQDLFRCATPVSQLAEQVLQADHEVQAPWTIEKENKKRFCSFEYIDKQIGGQTDWQMDGRMDGWTSWQEDRQSGGQMNGRMDRQTDIHRQVDR